jgi:PAS domain S-box-containing protein
VGDPGALPLRFTLAALVAPSHICCLHDSPQECVGILQAFLEVGISRGEKCVGVVPRNSEASFRELLRAASPRTNGTAAAEIVELTTMEHAYLTKNGLSVNRALQYWRRAIEQARVAGFSGLRGIIRADQPVGSRAALARWIDYENRLTQLLAHSGGALLCLYNRSVQSAQLIRASLRTHAIVATRGVIGESPFYVPPEEYSARNRADLEVDRMLRTCNNHWRTPVASVIRRLADEVAEHKSEQRELKRTMTYLAFGEEITRTGSWAWNPASGELFWSREHFRIFGLDPARANVSYQVFVAMVHAEERAQVEREFQAAVAAGRDFDSEYRIVRPDGTVKHIHSHAHPLFGESGDLTEYVGTVVDITELRHGEESLGSMQAELHRTSRAQILTQLAASIGHEVNQPLAAVIVNANAALRWLAQDTPRIDKARQAMARVVRDGNRASDVISRIRSLVRRSESERRSLSLNSVVQEVIALLRTELRRNNITVRTNLAENLRPIQADRVQMQQVLLNLITNAIEAMSTVMTPRRVLTVTTLPDDTGIGVAVEDCGVGFEHKTLERVFEPFYTTKPQGTGIGLAISRSIIEAHGGRLWAVSNAPSGAILRFTLPFEGAGTG